MAAGAGMDRHAQRAAADQAFEPVEFGKRQMRAADRHRVDGVALATTVESRAARVAHHRRA